ncbi:MAG: TaqI-like C-terminal specificity domain-containing protein [Polyangia bacterium]
MGGYEAPQRSPGPLLAALRRARRGLDRGALASAEAARCAVLSSVFAHLALDRIPGARARLAVLLERENPPARELLGAACELSAATSLFDDVSGRVERELASLPRGPLAALNHALAEAGEAGGGLPLELLGAVHLSFLDEGKRKRGGVHFTPAPLAKHVIDRVLAVLRAEQPSFLDPACGGGAFLAPASRLLLERCGAPADPGRRVEIVADRVRGIESDPDTAAICRATLLLELSDGADAPLDPSAARRLSRCVAVGDSLSSPPVPKRPSAVIGNPPWVRPHHLDTELKRRLARRFDTYRAKSDLYVCFVQGALELLPPGGALGFVLSAAWLRLDSYAPLRRLLLELSDEIEFLELDGRVFSGAAIPASVLIARRGDDGTDVVLRGAGGVGLEELGSLRLSSLSRERVLSDPRLVFDPACDADSRGLSERLRENGAPLAERFEIRFGLKTGDDSRFLLREASHPSCQPLLRGADIDRYRARFSGWYVRYDPKEMRAHRRTARPADPDRFERPKLLVRDTGEGLCAAFDEDNRYVKDALIVVDPEDDSERLLGLLGALNSDLLCGWYERAFPTLHVQRCELAGFPIPPDRGLRRIAAPVLRRLSLQADAADEQELRRAEAEIEKEVLRAYGLESSAPESDRSDKSAPSDLSG